MKKSYKELNNMIRKFGYEHPEVVKYAKELEEQERKFMFIRSAYTGECFKTDFLPKFGGWDVISYETYLDYVMEKGLF